MIQSENIVSIVTEAKLANWSNVCAEIEKFLRKFHLNSKQISTVLVICEEVFVNVSSYAYCNFSGQLTLEFEWLNEERILKIISRDSGVYFNPLEFDVKGSDSTRTIGGNGIKLIKKLTDSQDYYFKNGFNVFLLSKKFG